MYKSVRNWYGSGVAPKKARKKRRLKNEYDFPQTARKIEPQSKHDILREVCDGW